jgi:hypothetical protein
MNKAAEAERRKRIADYQANLKRVGAQGGPRVLAAGMAARTPRVLAEGDSWFDYPPNPFTGGVIDHLSDVSGVKILNTAYYGDTAQQMLGVEQRQRIEALLRRPGFDVLLFSGGGNDLAGDQFCLWLKPNEGSGDPAQAVDAARLRSILDVVESGYRDLIAIRDRWAPNCWIVTHAYDIPQPSDKGVCGLGPWLKPSLDYRGWKNSGLQFAIVRNVLSQFNDRLIAMETEQRAAGKNFLHVRTQGTLDPDQDWGNEIHPNKKGFAKIAGVFKKALDSIGWGI